MKTLLPPDHPDAPKYWMYEQSGILKPVVMKYLKDTQPLSQPQIQIMRDYLYQWISSPVWGGGGVLEATRLRVAAIKTQADIDSALNAMVHMGMDPL